MDYCLSRALPPELVDKIAREVHYLNMRDVLYQLKHCVTWIYCRYDGEDHMSFIVSNNHNYFRILVHVGEFGDYVEV